MTHQIKIFANPSFGNIRVTTTNEGNPLFCLADVCKALDLSNPSAVKSRLKKEGVYIVDIHTLNNNEGVTINELGNTLINFISESNLYKCIFQSRKQEAEFFQDWIYEEVIPSIRKTGGYSLQQIPSNFAQALRLAAHQAEELERQQALLEEQAPKVLFADAVSASDKDILIGELSTFIQQNGVKNLGQNKLFAYLRQHNYLCSSGERYNLPTQRAIDLEIFRVKVTSINQANGNSRISCTTKVTPKGQLYFINKFLSKELKAI